MLATRRNGQLPSCEPCRKSKLRCDHTKPVCGRCTRRRKQHLCIYHPAPLTRSAPPNESPPAPRRQTSPALTSPIDDRKGPWCYKKASLPPTFLGLTSYSEAYTDHASELGIESTSRTTGPIPVDEAHIKTGARALRMLKDLPLFRRMLVNRYEIYGGYVLGKPLSFSVLEGVEDMWKVVHEEEPDEDKCMLRLSKKLFARTMEPFIITPDMSWTEWVRASNGRWEAVGLLLTIVGVSTSPSLYSPLAESNWSDKHSIAVAAAGLGDLCLQFCDSVGVVNDMVCWILLYHTMLLTVVYGDSDYRPARKLGELTTNLYALGMHQECKGLPFFISEIRRRVIATAYTLDKALASFTGRPPLICWRYCSFDIPLDLSSEEIVAEPSVRDAAIAKLDSDGWNQFESLERGSGVRAFLFMSIGREQVLELSLDSQIDGLAERVENLSNALSKQYRELPTFLHWENRLQYAGSQAGCRLIQDLYLESLQNDFLLHRILAKKTQTQSQRGVAISLEILNAIITIISWRHQVGLISWGLSWNLCNAGVPSAGVLCAELLRRSRHQMSDLHDFPRSEIIQKLSIFASHLETMIGPNEGNYQIAQQGRRAIGQVLDQILSAPKPIPDPAMAISPTSNSDSNERGILCPELLENIDVEDRVQFLDWLDGTADTHEPWITWMNFG